MASLQAELGPSPKQTPIIIGIDGRWGAGKSSLASRLAWQLGVPAICLDLYIVRDGGSPDWFYEDLSRVIHACQAQSRPLIVEGVCLCQALQAIDCDPDYLVWVENEGGAEHGPEEPVDDYIKAFDPRGNAEFVLEWRQAETRSTVPA